MGFKTGEEGAVCASSGKCRRSRNAESKATSLKKAHEHPSGARSFESTDDYELSELPRAETSASRVPALWLL